MYVTDLGVCNKQYPHGYYERNLNVVEVELGHLVSQAFFAIRRAFVVVVGVVAAVSRGVISMVVDRVLRRTVVGRRLLRLMG